MIQVRCETSIEKYHGQRWPVEMVARPMLGDYVKSAEGKTLRVACITHATYKGCAVDAVGGHEMHPILEVELR